MAKPSTTKLGGNISLSFGSQHDTGKTRLPYRMQPPPSIQLCLCWLLTIHRSRGDQHVSDCFPRVVKKKFLRGWVGLCDTQFHPSFHLRQVCVCDMTGRRHRFCERDARIPFLISRSAQSTNWKCDKPAIGTNRRRGGVFLPCFKRPMSCWVGNMVC